MHLGAFSNLIAHPAAHFSFGFDTFLPIFCGNFAIFFNFRQTFGIHEMSITWGFLLANMMIEAT